MMAVLDYDLNRPIHSLAPAVLGLIVFIGVFGNSATIVALVTQLKMKTISNLYFLNIAVIDLIFVLCIPFLAYQFSQTRWIFGIAVCKLILPLDSLNQIVTAYTLVLVSIDRYFVIVYPEAASHIRSRKRAKVANAIVWVIAILLVLPMLVHASVDTGSDEIERCFYIWPKQYGDYWYIVYTFTVAYIIPFLCVSFIFILILKSYTKGRWKPDSEGTTNQRKTTKGVTHLVLLISVIYVVFWLPYYLVLLIKMYKQPNRHSYYDYSAYVTSLCFAYADSCINPLIYAIFSENFRQGFISVIPLWSSKDSKGITGEYRNWILRSWSRDYPRSTCSESAKSYPALESNRFSVLGLTSDQQKARRHRRRTI
ncbi:somatostatin receptor type 2-like [Glandiceps talaboti]